METIFISGIDTDAGKTMVTGLIARYLKNKGKNVITQKLVQTGCKGISSDICEHRRLMGINLLPEDIEGITCKYTFEYPASPHLAARLESRDIDIDVITDCTNKLNKSFDIVLLEGAGGLMVPITEDFTILDYIYEQNYPLILVSSSRLGSINHTLLSMEACRNNNINLIGIVYNRFPDNSKEITDDSVNIIQKYLQVYYPEAVLKEIPVIKEGEKPDIDFNPLI